MTVRLDDFIDLPDRIQRSILYHVSLSDLTELTDSLTRVRDVSRSLSDSVAIGIVQEASSLFRRTVTDNVKVIMGMLRIESMQKLGGLIVAATIDGPKTISDQYPLVIDTGRTLKTTISVTQVDRETNVKVQSSEEILKVAPPPASLSILGTPVEIKADPAVKFQANIRMFYTDEDLRASGLRASELSLYFFNETLRQWRAIPSVVNEVERYVEAKVDHFSIWAIMNRPVTAGLLDIMLGQGEINPSFSKFSMGPQAEIYRVVNMVNLGDKPISAIVKYWLTDVQGGTVWSDSQSLYIESSQTKTLPIRSSVGSSGRYQFSFQVIADGVQTEPATSVYEVSSVDVYGFPVAILLSITAALISVMYVQRIHRPIHSQRMRLDFPL
jgi:hypothetical protein